MKGILRLATNAVLMIVLMSAPLLKPYPIPSGAGATLVAWSPDGTKLVVLDSTGGVHIWDALTFTHLIDIQSPVNDFDSVAWSPDGTRLATNSAPNDGLRIWDVSNGQLIAYVSEVGDPDGGRGLVAWSPDGTKIATAQTTGTGTLPVHIWTATNDHYLLISTVTEGAQQVYRIDWSPNSTQLAIADSTGLYIASDLSAENPTVRKIDSAYGVYDVAWSPDGTRLALSGLAPNRYESDDKVHILNLGTVQDDFVLPNSPAISLAWNPQGDRLAVGANDAMSIWDSANGKRLETFPSTQVSFAWSPSGGRLAYLGSIVPSASRRTQVVGDSGVKIVVPAPSVSTLSSIAVRCIPADDQPQFLSEISANHLADFVTSIRRFTGTSVSPVCAADLIAVADALQS